MKRAFRLGITGKISSGKSTVAAEFEQAGITVLNTDILAKELMQSDDEVRKLVNNIFGTQAYTEDGINTSFIAEAIFSDQIKKFSLEKIIHPRVMQQIEQRFLEAKPGEIIAVESALLFQSGYDALFDAIILVACSDDEIVYRNKKLSRFEEEDLKRRLKDQAYTPAMEDHSDFVVTNDATVEVLKERSSMLIDIIKIMAHQDLPETPMRMND